MGRPKNALRYLQQLEWYLSSRSFQELYISTDTVRRLYLLAMSSFLAIVFSLAPQEEDGDLQGYAAGVLLRWQQANAEECGFNTNCST